LKYKEKYLFLKNKIIVGGESNFEDSKNEINELLKKILKFIRVNEDHFKNDVNSLIAEINQKDKLIREKFTFDETEYNSWYENIMKQITDCRDQQNRKKEEELKDSENHKRLIEKIINDIYIKITKDTLNKELMTNAENIIKELNRYVFMQSIINRDTKKSVNHFISFDIKKVDHSVLDNMTKKYGTMISDIIEKIKTVMLKLEYSKWSNSSCNKFDSYNILITELLNYSKDNLLNENELEKIEEYRKNPLKCNPR